MSQESHWEGKPSAQGTWAATQSRSVVPAEARSLVVEIAVNLAPLGSPIASVRGVMRLQGG